MVVRLILLLSVINSVANKPTAELVIYSSRSEHLLKPVLDSYSRQHGVNFKHTTGKAAALSQKLLSEGKNTKADLLITVDAGNLWFAASRGLLTPITSKIVTDAVPVHLRDDKMRWVGLSIRARTIVYDSRLVKEQQLDTYAGLADKKWRGKLCLRTSKKVYNRSLVAMLLAIHGEKKTEQIVKGWVANLATPVFSSDTKVIEAINAGQCSVGIVNSYYLGRLQRKHPNYPVKIFWANQKSSGVHVNISGIGIVNNSSNFKLAQKFVEWLVQQEAQKIFAELNLEYPIIKGTDVATIVASWGKYKANDLSLSRIGTLQMEAIKVMDRATYR